MDALEIISDLRTRNVVPRLVDGNLKLSGETSKLSQEFLQELRTHKQVLVDFLSERNAEEEAPITKVVPQKSYGMTNAQQRIWVLSQFEGGSEAYNIADAVYLKGKVQLNLFEKASQALVDRHESLRTYFEEENGVPVQKVQDAIPFKIETEVHHNISTTEVKERIKKFNREGFDLSQAPLFRVKMMQISEDEQIMLFNMHHIISDGWSLGVLLQEVMADYRNQCLNKPINTTPRSIQFKDYSAWLNERINGSFGAKARDHWSSKSLGEIEPMALPTDFPRSEKNSFQGASQFFELPAETFKVVEKLARSYQTTVFNFYRGVLNVLLHKWTNQEKLVVGTPVAGRSHSQLEDQIGLYVNTLPLVTQYSGAQSFATYIEALTKDSFATFNYQDYPLDLLVEENGVKREAGRNPLFDVIMAVQNTAIGDGSIDTENQHGFTLQGMDKYFGEKKLENNDASAKFDLGFYFTAHSGGENGVEIEYKTALFRKSTIQGLYKMLNYVIHQIAENERVLLKDIKIIDSSEHDKILKEFNKPIAKHQEDNILDLIRENLRTKGTTVAVVDEHSELTYAQLDKLSNKLGSVLASSEGSRVGLFTQRSVKMIATILGVWKCGKAYVPIDINYPTGRVEHFLVDSEIDTLLVSNESLELVPKSFKGTCVNVDELTEADPQKLPTPSADKDAVAYVIYTSGSTGQPKGVEITHRNAIALLKWSDKEFGTTPFEVMFAGTSYCFDLSVFEMLFPLTQGKRIRVLDSGVSISNYVQSESNIFINTVPSVVRNLLDEKIGWEYVVALNMAGEPVPKIFKDQLDYLSMEVRNLYGPSEDTTYSTCYRFKDDTFSFIPIGVPVGDTHAYILDEDNNMLPIGVEGEICLSGQSIAKGYLNQQKLTAEKFIDNPFVSGERMYRTGDIGKWTREGQLAFTGRKDDQVKVRGFRIELGEIQYQLDTIDAISQAVAVVKDVNNEKAIVSYYKLEKPLSQNEIKERLAAHLPSYMLPSFYVEMDAIPMNSNGKVDKKKLPEPNVAQTKIIIAPKTETQTKLLQLWETALNTSGFGIESNFFELGGHSLKATRLRSFILETFSKELTLNEMFENMDIASMAELIESKPIHKAQKIEKVVQSEGEKTPLSFAQERLWVLTKFENASKAYHMPAAFSIKGNLDDQLLEQAMMHVIERHESLRTIFREKSGVPYQQIVPISEVPFKLERITVTENLETFLKSRWSKPFDLENGPLLRSALLEVGSERIISFNMHHIISDGWSVGVLFNDVLKSYAQLSKGESGSLGDLEVQYKDFSSWQKKELSGEGLKRQLDYWKKDVFIEGIKPLELPYDYHRPEIKTFNGALSTRTYSKKISDAVEEQASEHGVSLYMSIMANVSVLLKKLSNQSDFVIGTPVAGREAHQLRNQIGFYVNTLPIRIETPGAVTFNALLKEVRQNLLEAFNYQNFPFEMLVEEVQPRRDTSRSPLFDVMVVMQNFDIFENNNLGLDEEITFEKVDITSGNTKYDLTFSFSQQENGIHLDLEYNTDLFKVESIDRLMDQLGRVFEQTTTKETQPIGEVNLISEAEKSILLEKSDFTAVGYEKGETIISYFEKAVSAFPDNIALTVGDQSWTYQELNEKSGQLAAKLVSDYKVKDEDLIVLHTHRNEWMLISILACLKSGAAYVPVDPAYPASRVEYILEDSGAQLVLADGETPEDKMHLFETSSWLDVTTADYSGEPFRKDLNPDQLAYIIYTSGTTGNPKGVLIEHKNVTRLLFNENNYFDFNENDAWTLFHSYCFDFSVWEMYGALLNGGKLVMVPKEIAQDSASFFQFLSDEKITVLNQTPTAFRSLCLTNESKFTTTEMAVRYVVFGGEALMPSTLKEWYESYPACKLINMYGITETTVHVTYKEIGKQEIEENKSNIGVPLPTLSCYVLDEDLKPSAPGVIGELCVGGEGVARGYHGKPELTADRFVANTFGGEGRLYRSGDYARLLINGDIEYIGRKDEQVKIRGHRIELAEVEAGVKQLSYVDDAVVLVKKNALDEYELTVYYILASNGESEGNLREDLAKELPSYMIPTHYVVLKEFPITPNGKLDKRALLEVSTIGALTTEYVSAENEIQETIVKIWEEVLNKDKVGIRDNFFDLGGHSLKATRIISKIQEVYNVKIDLASLFIKPTVENLAEHVSTMKWMTEEDEVESNGEELIL